MADAPKSNADPTATSSRCSCFRNQPPRNAELGAELVPRSSDVEARLKMRPYSALSAIIGSTLTARRAGM
jgi:hypothetical protein